MARELRLIHVKATEYRLVAAPSNGYGHLSLIRNDNWLKRGGEKVQFDQQPVEVMGLVRACASAYLLSGKEEWLRDAERCFAWLPGPQ